ncbi:hypothetical protein HNP40_000316 [Mycobacteroides chelonae]|nr:hypothetical protein [Mycobacteroides chelonae]
MKASLIIGAAMLAASTLSGCQVHIGSERVAQISKNKLEVEIKKAVASKSGVKIDDSSCDGPLPGRIGAKQKCVVLTEDGRKYGVEITTATVEGDDIQFDFSVDEKPMDSPK